uniref:Alpha-rhamnosidase-like protein n=1 Tax=Tetraselmis sp. GSL018 TaxID=582737 RepID=A0A061SC87_9CHLO
MLARTATDYDEKGHRADPVKNKKEIIYRGAQYLVHAKADPSGTQWHSAGKPVLDLPSPNAAGDVVRLRDGRLLVVYNHSRERKALGRSTLLVSMSSDGGSTWRVVLQLEDGPPNDITQEYSYPAIIQALDGMVHVTYTFRRQNIRHVVLDPTKLQPLKGKKFGKDYSGVKGHYSFSSAPHGKP